MAYVPFEYVHEPVFQSTITFTELKKMQILQGSKKCDSYAYTVPIIDNNIWKSRITLSLSPINRYFVHGLPPSQSLCSPCIQKPDCDLFLRYTNLLQIQLMRTVLGAQCSSCAANSSLVYR